MFGHLKAGDFVNLLEGAGLTAGQKNHIEGCPRCRATWESMRSMHAGITSLETDTPEPDWADFRSSVRDELLSRSVQRESTVRRWTGWAIRPAAAWALSLFMVAGMTTATVLWRIERRETQTAPAVTPASNIEAVGIEPAAEAIEAGPERSLFDDVVSLGEEQQEQFRRMLESAQKGAAERQ
jgi:hypothetical protein